MRHPPQNRALLAVVYRDRLSYSEAARLLHLAPNTVAVRLPAARKRLAHILDRLDLLRAAPNFEASG